jgi:antitoxin (DNA-binding transcriptional repressor) of toxin-antitoxin stability system
MGMKTFNIHEAKTHLSRLLKRVAAGIAGAGRPIARRVPVGSSMGKRVLGSQKGKFTVPEDFDAPLPEEILAEFER